MVRDIRQTALENLYVYHNKAAIDYILYIYFRLPSKSENGNSIAHITKMDIDNAIKKLPKCQNQAIDLRYRIGYTQSEIADIMECSQKMVSEYIQSGTYQIVTILNKSQSEGV